MEEIGSPYKVNKSRKIVAAALLTLIAITFLYGGYLLWKSSHGGNLMIGKVVQVGGNESDIGIVKEFKRNRYIVLQPLDQNGSRNYHFQIGKDTKIQILADSIEEYKQKMTANIKQTDENEKETTISPEIQIQEESAPTPEISDEANIDTTKVELSEEKKNGVPEPVVNPPAEQEEFKSHLEELREKGLVECEETIAFLAKKANQVDVEWRRYKDACAGKYSFTYQFGRDWFGIWDGYVSVSNETLPECRKILSDINRLSEEIKFGMQEVIEKARKNGVYPGDVRKLRKKYYMEWKGWE